MHLGVEEEAFINESLLFYGVGWRYTTLSLRLSHSTAHTQIWVCVQIPQIALMHNIHLVHSLQPVAPYSLDMQLLLTADSPPSHRSRESLLPHLIKASPTRPRPDVQPPCQTNQRLEDMVRMSHTGLAQRSPCNA
jgi:hypothetical protein